MMSTPFPPPQPRGIDYSLPTCGETRCNDHGSCVAPPGGGTGLVCSCELGYRGEFCEDTVNGALSIPLTLSVLAVIAGVLIVAFIFAKMRQMQKKRNRKHLAEKHHNPREHWSDGEVVSLAKNGRDRTPKTATWM